MSTRGPAAATALLSIGLAGCAGSQREPSSSGEPPREVLFVCEHGTVKSLLAKLLFERAAGKAGLSLRARSRGVAPDAAVPDWMGLALLREGFDVGAWRPAKLTEVDLLAARRVVVFDIALPVTTPTGVHPERWDGLPALSEDYAAGRRAIAARVDQLVAALKAEAGQESAASSSP